MKEVYLVWTDTGAAWENSFTQVIWLGSRLPTNCELRKMLNVNIPKKAMNNLRNLSPIDLWQGRFVFEDYNHETTAVWIEKREVHE